MLTPLFDAALEAKPNVIAFSFGSPGAYAEKAKAAGAKVMCQVQSMTHAREAVAAGADILVAQGNEAGGHTGTMNLLPLLVSVLDAFPDTPVLASGGIASGRALAAVLAAGADGAWAGTAFLATPECVEIPEEHKQTIVQSDGEDTIFTRAYDVLWASPGPKASASASSATSSPTNGTAAKTKSPSAAKTSRSESRPPRPTSTPASAPSSTASPPAPSPPSAPPPKSSATICDDAERLLRERPRDLLPLVIPASSFFRPSLLPNPVLIDLHTHTHPLSHDSLLSPDELVDAAKAAGLDAVCLTEHDFFWDHAEAAALSKRHDFLVIPGIEVNTEDGHIVVFGLDRFVYGMHRMHELARLADAAGAVMIAAHPYRRQLPSSSATKATGPTPSNAPSPTPRSPTSPPSRPTTAAAPTAKTPSPPRSPPASTSPPSGPATPTNEKTSAAPPPNSNARSPVSKTSSPN